MIEIIQIESREQVKQMQKDFLTRRDEISNRYYEALLNTPKKYTGLKELVKSGQLTRQGALNRLWAKSDTGMGGTGKNILTKTKTWFWLCHPPAHIKKEGYN